nr:MAG TPA: hypothetical protein [Caudoviricetes sp.]
MGQGKFLLKEKLYLFQIFFLRSKIHDAPIFFPFNEQKTRTNICL